MLEAAWWGFVGGAALLRRGPAGLYLKVGLRVIGLVMAFGAGVLISAVAFELTEEAYRSAGGTAAALGLAAGSLTFFTGDWLIDRQGRAPPQEPGARRGAPARAHRGRPRPAGRDVERWRSPAVSGAAASSGLCAGARGAARRHPRVGGDRHQPARRRGGGRRDGGGGVPVEHPRVDVGDDRAQGVRAVDPAGSSGLWALVVAASTVVVGARLRAARRRRRRGRWRSSRPSPPGPSSRCWPTR